MSASILRTPLQIVNTTRQVFPSTEAEIVFSPQGQTQLKLTLTNNAPPIILGHPIEAATFKLELNRLFENMRLNEFTGNTCPLASLNHHVFSINSCNLKDIYIASRIFYESKNKQSCYQMLIFFLTWQDHRDRKQYEIVLETLGISPKQIEDNLTDSENYFLSLLNQLANDNDHKKVLFQGLATSYPKMYNKFINKFIDKENSKCKEESPYKQRYTRLNTSVIGQSYAASILASMLEGSIGNPQTKTFLLVGPTGVGKTEMAKAVAKEKKGRFVSFSMNSYQSAEDRFKLFGPPPGYEGSADRPNFAKELHKEVKPEKNPDGGFIVRDAVILFDEFEKADSKVKQSMLDLFDEKCITIIYTNLKERENVSEKYEFVNCIFFTTSNLFQAEILKAFKNKVEPEEISKSFIELNKTIHTGNNISPELLGRIIVIPFGPIPRGEDYRKLLKFKLNAVVPKLKIDLRCKDFVVEKEAELLAVLESKLYGEGIDIRSVINFFEVKVSAEIRKAIGDRPDMDKMKFALSTDSGSLIVRVYRFVEFIDTFHHIQDIVLK